MIKSKSSVFRGGYYSHGKQFIQNIPIRIIDQNNPIEVNLYKEIIKTVEAIIRLKKAKSKTLGSSRFRGNSISKMLQQRLIQFINNLYSMDSTDVELVVNDEAFKMQDLAEE